MAKSQHQLETEYRATKCGQFLVEFMNTENPKDAVLGLVRNTRRSLKFKVRNPDRSRLRKIHDKIVESQESLRSLVASLDEENNLNKIDTVHQYVFDYNFNCRNYLKVRRNGTIVGTGLTEFSKGIAYDDILSYCVVTFLKVERNRRLLRRCQEREKCGRYFLAKSDRGKDKLRFCSNNCRSRYARYRKLVNGKR